MTLALLDFFNSREKASAFWMLVILGYAFTQNGRAIASSLLGTLRALFQWKLMLLFGSAAVYSASVVYVAGKLGVWHRAELKETIYWFLGAGVIFVGGAVASPDEPYLVRRVARRALRFTVLLEVFVGLYVLPLWGELVVVPVVLLFVMMQAVVEHNTSTPEITRKFIDGTLGVLGVVLLLWALLSVGHDLQAFFSRENAERLWVGPGLSLALVPFLYAVSRWSAWVAGESPCPVPDLISARR